MSLQDNRKLSSISRSIEVIEDKANKIYSDYTTSNNDLDHFQSTPIDDSNTHLQIFFQHLEHLLQIDLKNRRSLLNNKRNYWNFLALALKESKGLYDTVLYVLNTQDVKTSIGRGRLFLRFCLQNHRLGDVIQQSFMMTKLMSQFYNDDCFWTKPIYMNRIVQALYQLNDVQFDLLSTAQYQLDVCWPTAESMDLRSKLYSDATSRLRTSSISSFLSMDSLPSHLMISTSPMTGSSFQNFESSFYDESSAHSISSTDEYPENTLSYWKERCQHLEQQLQSNHTKILSNHVETQCSTEKHDQITQTIDDKKLIDESIFKSETEKLKFQKEVLQDEVNNLNFQLSSFIIQRTTTENKLTEYEREIAKHQTILDAKDKVFNELQRKFDEQTKQLKSIQDQRSARSIEQDKRIECLNNELAKANKLLETKRISFENEKLEYNRIQEQLEASLHEKTLDFEEMKRRLIKAIKEKADLFNSIYLFEVKLGEEQSKQWMHEDDVLNCSKCETLFGWTWKKYRCRHCHKIFCYYCANHWHQGSTPNSQHRLCDYCHEKCVKESLMTDYTILDDPNADNENGTPNGVNLTFEVRSERVRLPAENQSSPSEQ
ncbi:unnamed protein product [Rotaria magnacalcarata]|uniref:Uncharacterized protein n=1 Tax=Rotaria magnacalcarata TaxID=392030 RepID=A0A819TAH3_9BILA|nr:unnamed protein product [Rotaria magnacalcarata]CAF2078009.1 unnamed protein product [Rotaria magnacalcarata]CAF4071755.1 unnamed protein product [Rotaria magnacalcarata]CAF4129399.1 unnamed protein product [Rotaria magnacalcarata]